MWSTIALTLSSFALLANTVVSVPEVLAKNANSNSQKEEKSQNNKENKGQEKKAEAQAKIAERKAKNQENKQNLLKKQTKLEEKQLKACQAKEAGIQKRLEGLVRFVTNMERVFDAITEKVKEFYQKKLAAGAPVVTNYDALLADIAAKKAVVDADLETAKADAALFTCEGEDPKGALKVFKEDMRVIKDDLKEYRTSVRHFIQAVRGGVGVKDEADEGTESADEDDDADEASESAEADQD